MKLELRHFKVDGTQVTGGVLVSESEAESKILDQLFGDEVGTDGLIARRQVEVRLADGYREHYVYVVPPGLERQLTK